MGELNQEQWSRIEREQVALKEENVLVTNGKKKTSVRKETNAVSGMRVTIVPKNPEHTAATFRAILLTKSKCVEEKYPRQK